MDCQNLMKRMGIEFANIVMRVTSIPTKMFTDRSKLERLRPSDGRNGQ